MKKLILSLLLSICLLPISGYSASIQHTEICRYGNCITAQSVDLDQKPIIIFFPGYGECKEIADVMSYIEEYELYDNFDVNLMAVSFSKKDKLGNSDWYDVCEDILKIILPLDNPTIIIDCVSFGGFGGCYLTKLLAENGIIVKELNLADACNEGISSNTIMEILSNGTLVNIFAGDDDRKITANTQETIDELGNTSGFRGILINNCSHGAVLSKAISLYGLHFEYEYSN